MATQPSPRLAGATAGAERGTRRHKKLVGSVVIEVHRGGSAGDKTEIFLTEKTGRLCGG